jgi:hypothetical protein
MKQNELLEKISNQLGEILTLLKTEVITAKEFYEVSAPKVEITRDDQWIRDSVKRLQRNKDI